MAFFTQKNLKGYHFTLYPELEAFYHAAQSLDSQPFMSLLPHFERLVKSEFIANFLSIETQKIDEIFDYDVLNQDVGIDLLKLPQYTLTLGRLFEETLFGNNRPELVGFGSDMMFCNLGPGHLEIEIYETPDDQRLDHFDRNKVPVLQRKCMQKKGDIVTLKAGKEIIKLIYIGEVAFQLYLVSSQVQDLVWHYDEKTLMPKYSTAGKSYASRMQCATLMLGHLRCQSALPTLKKIAGVKEHFLRWNAIKTALALNLKEGYPLLLQALDDEHPHVRNAAQATIAKLKTLQLEERSR